MILAVFVRGDLDIVTCRCCSTNHNGMLGDGFVVGHFDIAFFTCIFPLLNVQRLEDIEAWVLLSCTQIHILSR